MELLAWKANGAEARRFSLIFQCRVSDRINKIFRIDEEREGQNLQNLQNPFAHFILLIRSILSKLFPCDLALAEFEGGDSVEAVEWG